MEYTNGFEPLEKDADGDGRPDLEEYEDGTDPYCYNKDWYEHVRDFICGFIAGNLANGDYAFAGLSGLGLVPVLGDGAKTVGKVGKFAARNIDDIPKIAGLLEFLSKNCPDAVKALNKSDEFVDAAKQLSKASEIKLTRQRAKIITEAFENAGLSHYLIKTSNSLDVKRTIDAGAEVWEQGPLKRGAFLDDLINGHSTGTGLGKNFPVADRLLENEKLLVSTKSIDTAAQSYQKPGKLKRKLVKDANALKNFEKNYFKGEDFIRWGNKTLHTVEYNKKVLEVVLPDVIISEDALKVLKDFKISMEASGLEVWYCIAK